MLKVALSTITLILLYVQTRGPKVQKWMFLLFVLKEFIFHLIFVGILLKNSSGKFLAEKCIYYYVTITIIDNKVVRKGGSFVFNGLRQEVVVRFIASYI